MTEQDDWRKNFGEALSVLDEEITTMLVDGVYKDPRVFLDWASKVVTKTLEISPVCSGSQLALLSCDEIEKFDNGKDMLQGIVGHAKSLGIVSEVSTNSLRYTASVVISIYLDQKGLGSKFIN